MIAKGLQQNPELVYTLLHRQDVFSALQVRHSASPNQIQHLMIAPTSILLSGLDH